MTRQFRVFSPQSNSCADEELILPEDESRHLCKVLRARKGSVVEVLDGLGSIFKGVVCEADHEATRLKISKLKSVDRPNPFFRVAFSMTKSARWEELIRPLTEMGAGRLTPLVSDRTESKVSRDKESRKLAKWEKLAIEASKQSGNPWLPLIDPPMKLEDLLRSADHSFYLGSLRASSVKPLVDLGTSAPVICLVVGPEGGWTRQEEEFARSKGAEFFSLGPNVLRAETAALCALAVARSGFLG
ncbi:MAG TPA: hypothetical protein DCG39_10355 [Opitutae bacterium]|nr:hypothetical protein [Opitutae bacterium]|tara:strand:- start:1410 stop:2141 length:732 start_codon:yes stop_codon:yes gene_type:complete